ncbi:LysR family transcriptional regulator ArgP [Leucobacter sp. MMO-125]|uniref:LysR family transcriptional regulator ArgP n=1 Tax=Leucobacter sp. MMO-125 TaxID=3081259 RepID=UPI003018B71B
MDLPVEHLATFAAIIDEGSFEGAARRLHITPSAVSQRVRSMEQRVGSVLLRRTRPVETTTAGSAVLRAARQVERVLDDVAEELGQGPSGGTLIPVVVNADSLATWFVPALARAARETGARFEVVRSDETVSTERLRSGEVMAALTATAEAVPGCTSTLIGVDRYRAVAAPSFVAEHFSEGVSTEALSVAPMIEFDRHDMFQRRFIERVMGGAVRGAVDAGSGHGDRPHAAIEPPRHLVPSSAEFALAVELGMGWGMLPHRQCAEALASDRMVELVRGSAFELPLYWQRWNLRSPVLDRLSEVIAEEAAIALDVSGAR